MTQKQFLESFSTFGEILFSKISYSFDWKGPREDESSMKGFNPAKLQEWRNSNYEIKQNGYGYVCFKNKESAEKAIKQKVFKGMVLEVFDLEKKKQ